MPLAPLAQKMQCGTAAALNAVSKCGHTRHLVLNWFCTIGQKEQGSLRLLNFPFQQYGNELTVANTHYHKEKSKTIFLCSDF